jgi:hypothetical protein
MLKERNEMKRLNALAAATALSLLAISSVAQAREWSGENESEVSRAVEMIKSKNFEVVRLDSLAPGNYYHDEYVGHAAAHTADIQKLQTTIAENKNLMNELKAQNVEIANIVAVDEAANGSFTFYLR